MSNDVEFINGEKLVLQKLLPFLADSSKGIMSPSTYIQEMRTTTEERYKKLTSPKRKFNLPCKCRSFRLIPDCGIFQNFLPGISQTISFNLLNITEGSRKIRAYITKSPHFVLSYPGEVLNKVAPGMSFVVNVTFTGENEFKDYLHRVEFETDLDSFSILIIAIGSRPLLSLPDVATLPLTAVKVPCEKNIEMRNLGKIKASFVLRATPPFKVFTTKTLLEVGDSMRIRISCCNHKTVGLQTGLLEIIMDDGIILSVKLKCQVERSSVSLDTDLIEFEETFMNLKHERIITLTNEGEYPCHFQWKSHFSREEEEASKQKITDAFEQVKESEKHRYVKLQRARVLDREGHAIVYERIYQDELDELKDNELFLFKNENFIVIPLEGTVEAHCKATFTFIFFPTKAEKYEKIAYLDATGIQERIPLKLVGSGLGPLFNFNAKILNANIVYITAQHQYEIVVTNSGLIPGNIKFIEKDCDFGGIIQCTPTQLEIKPHACKAFVLKFLTHRKGKFLEKIDFLVEESNEIIYLLMRGEATCPLLSTTVKNIAFGNVPFGYTFKQTFELINKTQVSIDFAMDIKQDISKDNIFLYESLTDLQVMPNKGIVEPFTQKMIEVVLTANMAGQRNWKIIVTMWNTEEYNFVIPVSYTCSIANIICNPSKIILQFCFINHPYQRKVVLCNESDIPGFVSWIPPACYRDNCQIECHLSKTEFRLEPQSTEELDMTIICRTLGSVSLPLRFKSCGETAVDLCKIICYGQGPCLWFEPPEIVFGQIKLLQEHETSLIIKNDSPVEGSFSIMMNTKAFFRINVDPEEILTIQPNEQRVINVFAYLTNPGIFRATALVKIECGETMEIKISAEGYGTSILAKPNLEPELNLGYILTCRVMRMTIQMMNLGKASHKLLWSSSNNINQHKEESLTGKKRTFTLEPSTFDLEFEESAFVTIEGYSRKPGIIEEDYYCYATISQKEKACIMSTVITAHFIDPFIEPNKKKLDFFKRIGVDQHTEFLIDDLTLSNRCGEVISSNIIVVPPFYLMYNGGETSQLFIQFDKYEEVNIKVGFAPPRQSKRCSKFKCSLTIDYKNHPKSDYIPLTAQVNYPTLGIFPEVLRFESVPIASSASKTVIIKNMSDVPLVFKWEWCEDSFKIDNITTPKDKAYLTWMEDVKNLHIQPSKIDYRDCTNKTVCFKNKDLINQMKRLLRPLVKIPSSSNYDLFTDTSTFRKLENVETPVSSVNKFHDFNALLEERQMSKLLVLGPLEGCLDAYESTLISVAATTPPYTKLIAHATCHILGGEEENLQISASSIMISYQLNKNEINFGLKLCCEVYSDDLILTNIGTAEFTFKVTDTLGKNEASLGEGTYIQVSPRQGVLKKGDSVILQVTYFAGFTGYFEEDLKIYIGYLEPIIVKVKGFSVISHIELSLPRSDEFNQEPDIMYLAAASVTEEFLVDLRRTFKKCTTTSEMIKLPGPISDRELEGLEDWDLIDNNEWCPSPVDFDMAVERILAYRLFKSTPGLLKDHVIKKKIESLPQLILPGYKLNFGYVIVNCQEVFNINIRNYGPEKTMVRVNPSEKKMLENKQFYLNFNEKNLVPGDSQYLTLIFKPSETLYKVLHKEFRLTFHLSVVHGGVIPITISATVTCPRMTMLYNCYNFQTVRLGDCLRKSLMLINPGNVAAKWSATIFDHGKKKKNSSTSVSKEFFLFNKHGILNPAQKHLLDVFFEPASSGPKNAILSVSVFGQQPILTTLLGYCMEPQLVMDKQELIFPAVLPYSEDNEAYIKLQNTSPFAVEITFPELDSTVVDEEFMIYIFMKYYKTSEVYIPYRAPGASLPPAFTTLMSKLLKEVSDELAKGEEALCGAEDIEDNISKLFTDIQSGSVISSPLASISTSQIHQLIDEYVESKISLEKIEMPFKMNSTSLFIEPEVNEKEMISNNKTGLLVLFVGAPETSSLKAATEVGKTFSVPVYTLDKLILETLLENKSDYAYQLNTYIDMEYNDIMNLREMDQQPEEDEYDYLNRKITIVLREKHKSPTRDDKKDIKTADGKKVRNDKKSSPNIGSTVPTSMRRRSRWNDLLTKSPEELFQEVLNIALDQFRWAGIVIESLDSAFFPKLSQSLTALLKAAVHFQKIQCVMFHYTFLQHQKALAQQIEEARIEDAKNYSSKWENILMTDPDDYDNLSAKELDMLEEYLNQRKERHRENTIAYTNKIQARISKKLSLKKKSTIKADKKKTDKYSVITGESAKPVESEKAKSKKDRTPLTSGDQFDRQTSLKMNFGKFEGQYMELLHILEFWDCDQSILTKSFNSSFQTQQPQPRKTRLHKIESAIPRTSRLSVRRNSLSKPGKDHLSTILDDHYDYGTCGIPTLVVNFSGSQNSDVIDIILNYLDQIPEFSELRTFRTDMNSLLLQESSTMFTVLRQKKLRKKRPCSVFSIYDWNIKSEFLRDPDPTKSTSEVRTKKKKKKKEDKKGSITTDKVSSSIDHGSKSDLKQLEGHFTPRHVMGPGEILEFRITFTSEVRGVFEHSFPVEIIGCSTVHGINCKAICDIPSINLDPNEIFPKCITSRTIKNGYDKGVYVKDLKIFDFGFLIYCSSENLFKLDTYRLNLTNISKLPCDTYLHISDSSVFSVEPTRMLIDVGNVSQVTISAKPNKLGSVEASMYISIRDNPKVEVITLKCHICTMEFDIIPKSLNFEKIVFNYSEKKFVLLKNATPNALFWKLADQDWNKGLMEVSNSEGVIGPCSSTKIYFAFCPKNVAIVTKKSVEIQVFDSERANIRPYYTGNISIALESFEAVVEFKPELVIGEVKGKLEYKYNYTFLNKGKYNAKFKFSIEEPVRNRLKDFHDSIRKNFKMHPESGTLLPGKPFHVSIKFLPLSEINFSQVPLRHCIITDAFREDAVLHDYFLFVSGRVFLSSFKINPLQEMLFGHQQIGTIKSQFLEIKNTGEFEFEYTIIAPKTAKVELEGDYEDSKLVPTEVDPDKDKTKKVPATIELRGFSISKTQGIVKPGSCAMVEVYSRPTELKNYEELIHIFVSEAKPEDARAHVLKLFATGCEPCITSNFENIFKEQHVVEKLEYFNCPDDTEFYCVYVMENNTLYFKRATLFSTQTVKLAFKNTGYVTANTNVKILHNTNNTIAVSPNTFDIYPYEVKEVCLSFTPNGIQSFFGTLEMTYNATTQNRISLNIVGEGVVPMITVLEPHPVEDAHVIAFNPTLVGTTTARKIIFKNTGLIKCKVLVEIGDDEDEVYCLVATGETRKMIELFDPLHAEYWRHTVLVHLNTGQVADFDLQYAPKKDIDYFTVVKIHVVNNPYEIINIKVSGQAFFQDISLELLEPFVPNNGDSSIFLEKSICYKLIFPFTSLNVLEKKEFVIKNHSDVHTYKFVFPKLDNISFIPAVGHLKPLTSKEIISTFITKESIYLKNEPVRVELFRITYIEPPKELLSWDERQEFVTMDDPDPTDFSTENNAAPDDPSGARRRPPTKVQERSEPPNIIDPNFSELITLAVTVSADFANYHIDISELQLPNTDIMDKSSVSFVVKNPGFVPIYLIWGMELDEELPSRLLSNYFPPFLDIAPKKIQYDCDSDINKYYNEDASSQESTLFSSRYSYDSQNVWKEGETLPFQITPQEVSINPDEEAEFTVTFAPTEVAAYKVKFKSFITGLHPDRDEIEIKASGCGTLPLFYFDLPPSDYLSNFTAGLMACGGIDMSNAKVIEFESIGIHTNSTRTFNLINPTKDSLSFKIENMQINGVGFFTCFPKSGTVNRGKKYELMFTFNAQQTGTFEGHFLFTAVNLDIKVPFLLVGICRRPKVYFMKTIHNMTPTVLGIPVVNSVVLRSEESIPLTFEFVSDSFHSNDLVEVLVPNPSVGVLLPNHDTAIDLKFEATRMGISNYSLKCRVERNEFPLCLNVVANCVQIQVKVVYVNKEQKIIELDPTKSNEIDFGSMFLKHKQNYEFTIINTGETGFYYNWVLNSLDIDYMYLLTVSSQKGFLPSKEQTKVYLSLEPLRRNSLTRYKIKLCVLYGPTYVIYLSASAQKNLCNFSFRKFDFGTCLVQSQKSSYYSVALKFSNNDIWPILLENRLPDNEHLTVDFKAEKIKTGTSRLIPICFHPQNLGPYKILIPFTVNSVEHLVTIVGEAVELMLEVESPKEKLIDFGAIKVGNGAKKTVRVVNMSKAKVQICVGLLDKLPFNMRPCELVDSNMKITNSHKFRKTANFQSITKKYAVFPDDRKEEDALRHSRYKSIVTLENIQEIAFINESIIVVPGKFITVEPLGKFDFQVKFIPKQRIQSFCTKIYYEVHDTVEPFITVKGSSVAPEFSLDKTYLALSGVVVGCKHSSMVCLRNTGDLSGNFKWYIERSAKKFSLKPMSGKISANTELYVTVTFAPTKADELFKGKARCKIEGYPVQLELILCGSSVKMPVPIEVPFCCPVRSEELKMITLNNNTNNEWQIKPQLVSEYFHIDKQIDVDPHSSTDFQVLYKPQGMIDEQNPHKSNLFLPLPEGQGILYHLIGKTLPPLPIGTIYSEIKAKTQHIEILRIQNWSTVAQIFKVSSEQLNQTKCLYKVFGSEVIDLPPNDSKDYKWGIFVINEMPLDFNVIFTSDNGEYMFYEIHLRVLPNGPQEIVTLKSCVRSAVTHIIKLQNHIDTPVSYMLKCIDPALHFDRYVDVDPFSYSNVEVIFTPLKVGKTTSYIEAYCDIFGTYIFEFELIALPPVAEPVTYFETTLGEKVVNRISIKNNFSTSADVNFKFQNDVFYLESKAYPIPPRDTSTFSIVFDPCSVQEVHSKLIVTSTVVGEYLFPLFAVCKKPYPKGPYLIKPGSSVSIQFTNPFNETKTFNYKITSNTFFMKTEADSIKAKKTFKVTIFMHNLKHLDSNFNPKYPITGKLIITTDLPDLEWVYYLQSE